MILEDRKSILKKKKTERTGSFAAYSRALRTTAETYPRDVRADTGYGWRDRD